ncbi:hypothetical protein KCG48_10465 [Proteiniclasticum sp. BAD-10]|uniref:Phage gp6-like head-tail connector protein n=1 Tax=Proteiniclasticum sediminis TaxID=2804028 RepID=A0A941CPZ4_9CLOT|nr:hypothetical protein [Proteiniclasticum sediminis]MBR0576755.1 hypothetical protein [Proteiniclasticum sediminis]
MTKSEILSFLKARLGISSNGKDAYLNLIIDSTIKMLDDEKGINADLTNPVITEFIVDYATWKYEAKGETTGMPRYLDFALKNLMIHNRKADEVI